MRNIVRAAALVLLALVVPSLAMAAQKQTLIRFNFVKSSSDPTYKSWRGFCDAVEKKSNGTLKIEIFPSESLGRTTDVIESITKGAPMWADCDPSHLSDMVPDWAVFMHPYIMNKPEDIDFLWKSDLGRELCGELEKKGVKLVVIQYFGTRNLITNKPVRSRADTRNLKLRCAPTKMWNEVVNVLGGNITNTAWSEVYMALSQGVADGAESPFSLLYSAKLYEPCKYIALTEHLIAPTAVVMSKKFFDSLPEEARKAIDEVSATHPLEVMLDEFNEIENDYRKRLESEGVTVTEVDKAPFREAARNVSRQFPEWTPGLYDRVRSILAQNN